MVYYFNKYKFSTSLFYKKIEMANIKHESGVFHVTVVPFYDYCGKYHIYSVAEKDSNRTLYLTMKSQDEIVNFDLLHAHNKFYISLSYDGSKAMIFNADLSGIILKG